MNRRRIPNLLSHLKRAASTSTVHNPYHSAACSQNLTAYLRTLCSYPYSGHLLIGEAPGYKGCALTGIPFTSQRALSSSAHQFIHKLRPSLAVAGAVTEPTATIVWEYLDKCSSVPAMWNVFPFHPHKIGNRQSNRTPKAAEVQSGKPFVQMILDILCPDSVIAVGGTSAKSLGQMFPNLEIETVRHPSFGGKSDFVSGVEAAGIV